MDINHVILAQSFLTGPPMVSELMVFIEPFMVFLFIMMAFGSFMWGNIAAGFMGIVMAVGMANFSGLVSAFVFSETKKTPARTGPLNEFLFLHDMAFMMFKIVAILAVPAIVITICAALVGTIHAKWKGWFEFRVSVITIALRLLYWKLGIKDPLARVMVAVQRIGDCESLSLPELAETSIEHQPWMPWLGAAGDTGETPSDYTLIEVTMFDHDGVLSVDPATLPRAEPVEGLYWRGVPGTEIRNPSLTELEVF
jgi:hypothetical protein